MIRAFHTGLGRVRLALAHIRASVGSSFRAIYLRPFIYTTNVERVQDSAFWWGLVERKGTIIVRKGIKYAPRKMRRRRRTGMFLARHLGLEPSNLKDKWREQITVEQNNWALSLKAIVYSVLHPKPVGTGGIVPVVQRSIYDVTTGKYVQSRTVVPPAAASKPTDLPGAVEVAWYEMTPTERRKATRKASQDKTVAI